MEKEYVVNHEKEITLNITDGKIDSYRQKEETRTTVRAYADGKIGVAGALGETDLAALEKQAGEKLADGIPYPCKLSAGGVRRSVRAKLPVAEKDLIRTGKRIAKKVAAACPRFLVNGKISLASTDGSYKNSKNTDFAYENHAFGVFLQVKDRDSSNIADAYYDINVNHYGATTENKLVADMQALHDGFFGEKITLPDGKYPMIFEPIEIINHVFKDFIAEYYASGGSLFNGKLGEKIADERVSLYADRNPVTTRNAPFYDAEGETAPNFRAPIVENGVFKTALTTKNTAAMFNLPLSKTSGAPYDGVPSLAIPGLYMTPTAPDLKTLLGNERAILVAITSGGDITSEGVMGLPVQLAFLVENGKITARVTDFSASGNVKSMLNEDFVGTSSKGVFEASDRQAIVVKMNLING